MPAIIAHRGYTHNHAENTLASINDAFNIGVRYIEIDIQCSADGVPYLFHDEDIFRVTGKHGLITQLESHQLDNLKAIEPSRLGENYTGTRLTRLTELVKWLETRPEAIAFIEVKEESLNCFGLENVIDTVMDIILPVHNRCIPLSYSSDAVAYARQTGAAKIAWVLRHYDEIHHKRALTLLPDIIFCNYKKFPETNAPLWQGPWQWAAYEINDERLALEIVVRGVNFIEGMNIQSLIKNPQLSDAAQQ
ncbi:MAG: glycerophosphodiester phosphodiesterase family protein [Gammaproteobacteria bacterium]